MAEITLVTGGCRSGKSQFALEYSEKLEGKHIFVATCPIYDKEMKDRIDEHKAKRDPFKWKTIEEQINIDKVLSEFNNGEVVVIDCLTHWLTNLVYKKRNLHEYDIEKIMNKVLDVVEELNMNLIIVTNEVGMGLIPEDEEHRQFRDGLGKANQIIAGRAEHVYFVTCGIPLAIKGMGYA